jgi:hypothetical protein
MRRISTFRIFGSLTLFLIIFALAFPRFDLQDIGLIGKLAKTPNDAQIYANYVLLLRGEDKAQIDPPFIYRPVVPLIASLMLIKSPVAAIATVSIIFLCLTALLLIGILEKLGFTLREAIFGGVLFAFSYPVLFLSSTGLVDPGGMFFIALGFWAFLKKIGCCSFRRFLSER